MITMMKISAFTLHFHNSSPSLLHYTGKSYQLLKENVSLNILISTFDLTLSKVFLQSLQKLRKFMKIKKRFCRLKELLWRTWHVWRQRISLKEVMSLRPRQPCFGAITTQHRISTKRVISKLPYHSLKRPFYILRPSLKHTSSKDRFSNLKVSQNKHLRLLIQPGNLILLIGILIMLL